MSLAIPGRVWQGWLLTLALAGISLVFSTALGLVAALGKRSPVLIIRYLATSYVEIIRGDAAAGPHPCFVLRCFPASYRRAVVFGVLALSLFSGAYLAEIFRAGIESVGFRSGKVRGPSG